MSVRDYVKDLDESMPAAKNARLGTTIQALIDAVNKMAAFFGTAGGGTGVLTSAGLVRGSTDTRPANVAFNFFIAGLAYNKAAVAAGTAIGAQTVPANKWALYRMSIQAGGTITNTPAAGNATGYASEALAKAAIPATPANEADMGYFTVLTMTDTQWIAATDALAGGTSGNEASVTNYYNAALSLPIALTKLNDLP